MHNLLFILPLVGAFIGWLVIRLFFWLLFHPARPVNFLGFRIQGILPMQQPAIAERIGMLAAGEFRSMNLEEKISDPASLQKIMPMVEEHVDDFLRVKLKAEIPMIGMFIGDKMIASFKKVFMREIETLFPQLMRKFAGNLQEEIQIENKVRERIETISLVALEQQALGQNARALRKVYVFAALAGLLLGLAEWAILSLLA